MEALRRFCVYVSEGRGGLQTRTGYGVATISRLLEIISLFAKEPYKRDYILQKRPVDLMSLPIVATPYSVKKS